MKAASLLCLAALSSGCLVHAVRETTSADVGTLESSPRHGALGKLTLDARAASTTLMISAARPRECARNVYRVTELRTGKTAKVDAVDLPSGGGGGGGAAGAVMLVLVGVVAVTGVITGTATMIELAVDKDKVERHATLSGVRRYPCPVVAAELPVDVVLASGTLLTGTTDSAGRVRIEIPDGEPAQGHATVRAADAQFYVTYTRSPNPRCTAARIAMFDHINDEPDRMRRATLLRAMPSCSTTQTEDLVWDLTKSAAIAASEGNCYRARMLAHQVSALDANHYRSVFLKHVEIAGCVGR